MKYQVFHRDRLFSSFSDEPLGWPERFTKVAEIPAEHVAHLEQAYILTQNIDVAWADLPQVEAVNGPARSTSVGDVIIDPEGNIWQVASFGFEPIAEEPATIQEN